MIASARDSGLCLVCHKDKKAFTAGGAKRQAHVVNVVPKRVKVPEGLFKGMAKFGRSGEIICETCHKVHGNNIEEKLLLMKRDRRSTLCLTCHSGKRYLAGTKHDLHRSAPDEKNAQGRTVGEAGICSACHLPHQAARNLTGRGDDTARLCLSCHSKGNIAEKALLTGATHPLNVRPLKNGVGTGNGLSLPLFNRFGIRDGDGEMTCASCHDAHGGRNDHRGGKQGQNPDGEEIPPTSFLRKPAPKICAECHTDKFDIENSKHDLLKTAPDTKNILDRRPSESGLCGGCHIVHHAREPFLWARGIHSGGGNILQDLCTDCHKGEGMAGKKEIRDYNHPVDIAPSKEGMTTTLPLFDIDGKLSETGMISCPTCHDPHRWNPVRESSEAQYGREGNAQNSFLRMEKATSPKLCIDCHGEKASVEKTDHDLKITVPSSKNLQGQEPLESGTCGVCHLMHNSKNRVRLWARDLGKGSGVMGRMCYSCHSKGGVAKNKTPRIASHPGDRPIVNIGRNMRGTPNYFPLFHATSGEPVHFGNISCPSCHDAHRWDSRFPHEGKGGNVEGDATNSFLRTRAENMLCQDCHGPEALYRLLYYHEPDKRIPTAY